MVQVDMSQVCSDLCKFICLNVQGECLRDMLCNPLSMMRHWGTSIVMAT
jgi:hypothetical protein